MSIYLGYEAFTQLREDILRERPKVLDLSNTALKRAMGRYRPSPPEQNLPATAHRCHLAEDWLALFGLPPEWRRRALIGIGVRDSLDRLFSWYGRTNAVVGLPGDVYPVYVGTAARHQLRATYYSAYEGLDPESLEHPDVILICNPAKPRGSCLTAGEMERLLKWLKADVGRRVVIDAVYTFGTQFDQTTLRLLETGQAWLLHSLSKGWAHPLVLGVAVAPESDLELPVSASFRDTLPDRDMLRLAHSLLNEHGRFPDTMPSILTLAEARMRDELGSRGLKPISVPAPVPRYLFTVEGNWYHLLEKHSVLAMPLSVFGLGRKDISVVSSLGYL